MRRISLSAASLLACLAVAAPAADAAKARHTVKVRTTVFANTVGSLTNGGSVLAGATDDPKLGHGAAVLTVFGTTSLHGTFQVFYALGTIKGTGTGTVTPGANGAPAKFTGSFTVTGGTGRYRGAKGHFSASGTVNAMGMVMATGTGSFTY